MTREQLKRGNDISHKIKLATWQLETQEKFREKIESAEDTASGEVFINYNKELIAINKESLLRTINISISRTRIELKKLERELERV